MVTPVPTGCTVRAATTGLCGATPVLTFKSRSGRVYAEHAEPEVHEPSTMVAVGSLVELTHVGVVKTGRVVRVTPTLVVATVTVGTGRTARVKTVTRPRAEVTVL